METTHACINCGSPVDARYCSQCGQVNPPKHLNLLTLYTDFQSRIYGFDGMFPRTLRDLTVRPGTVALQYIQGNRVKYVAPVGYFFLALTMYLVIMELLSIDLYELSKSNNPLDTATSENQEKFQRYFSDLMSRYMRIFSFLLIPITAAFALLFFRKQKLNILEHSILVFYISGHLLWFSLIALFIYKLTGFNLNIYQLILQAGFYAFGCIGLYTAYRSHWAVFFRAVCVCVLSFLGYILFTGVIGAIYLMSNPDMVELFKGGQ